MTYTRTDNFKTHHRDAEDTENFAKDYFLLVLSVCSVPLWCQSLL